MPKMVVYVVVTCLDQMGWLQPAGQKQAEGAGRLVATDLTRNCLKPAEGPLVMISAQDSASVASAAYLSVGLGYDRLSLTTNSDLDGRGDGLCSDLARDEVMGMEEEVAFIVAPYNAVLAMLSGLKDWEDLQERGIRQGEVFAIDHEGRPNEPDTIQVRRLS